MEAIIFQCFNTNGVLSRMKTVRNHFLRPIEVVFLLFNCLLFAFGWIILICGVLLLSNEQMQKGQYGFEKLKGGVVLFLLFFLIFISAMAAVGVLIGQRRECHASVLLIYGVSVFFFGAIPLLVEGSEILKFTSIAESDYKLMCNLTLEEIEDKPRWMRQFVQTAYRFDLMSETLLNKYMCSETCPCRDYNQNDPKTSPRI